jgi:hypothetical protein
MVGAIAELVSAIAWPTVIAVLLLTQRSRLTSLIDRIESVSWPGGGAQFGKQVERESDKVLASSSGATPEVSERQLQAAANIGELSLTVSPDVVRRQIHALAEEYERVRAAMAPGDARTRRLELIATRMRTLGRAARPYLSELMTSASAGERLAAIASFQVAPTVDPAQVSWLGDRVIHEKPFVGYHAAVALVGSARVASEDDRDIVREAITKAKRSLEGKRVDTDRWNTILVAEAELARNGPSRVAEDSVQSRPL